MFESHDLNGQWEFIGIPISGAEFDTLTPARLHTKIESSVFQNNLRRKRNWMKSQVPGDNIQDLLKNKKIPHPFKHENASKLQWTERELWCYRRRFVAPDKINGRAELVFDGLDTFATVFLNGQIVGRASNMFHPWRFNLSDVIRAGTKNELLVIFHPWEIHTRGKDISDQWAFFCKQRVHMRKAQMETGWDWGPRIVLSGIWKPVRLEINPAVRIAAWHFKTLKADKNSADVEVEIELDRNTKKLVDVTVTISNGQDKLTSSVAVKGKGAKLKFNVPNPKLWWPRNIGKPELYDVTVMASINGHSVHEIMGRSGIRTVSLLQKQEKDGCKSFTFIINGRKVYMAGVNWIPAHSFLSSVKDEDYRIRLQAAADANMNTIRVWGGGVYEDERFYEICDELGLMVWQDFMFACGFYPGNDAQFIANITEEFAHVIRRLRVHPSIVVWNGNNECQWIDDQVHWNDPGRKMPDRNIYHKILPRMLRQLDGMIPYQPSSPFGGNDDNDWREGTHHSYKVWVGIKLPRKRGENPDPGFWDMSEFRHYRHYTDVVPRFVGEFSAQGLPYARTLRKYLTKQEMDLSNKVLYFRDKHSSRLETCKSFMADITGWGSTYSEVEMKSQYAQARAMEFGICHYRQHLWQCSGSLIWQLNDCWPGFSWSLLDYEMLPKPAYFAVKRAYAPRILTIVEDSGIYSLWGVNTSGKDWKGKVRITCSSFDGSEVCRFNSPLNVPNDMSEKIIDNIFEAGQIKCFERTRCFMKAEIVSGSKTCPAWYHDDPVRIDLPKTKITTKLTVRKAEEFYHHKLTLNSSSYALFVGIIPPDSQCQFEDNFINIEPNGQAHIHFTAMKKYKKSDLEIRGFNVKST